MHDPEPTRRRNGPDDTVVRRKLPTSGSEPEPLPVQPHAKSLGWTLFSVAFALMIILLALGIIAYLGWEAFRALPKTNADGTPATASDSSAPYKAAKGANLFANTGAWELGQEAAKNLDGDSATSDIGWWTRTFDLPKQDYVLAYLTKQGLDVTKIVPAHYEEAKDTTTITYDVFAVVPTELLKIKSVAWKPTDPQMTRFTKVLVLNNGLPAGLKWDAQTTTVAAQAGTKLNFAWRVQWEKDYNTVETDRLPFTDEVFTQAQVDGYQGEAANTIAALQTQMDQIAAGVQGDVQSKLAQVPANPPKPELVPAHWNHGDGSGEPTKSAERIGGGTVAGAAGGAAIGAAAGDAGTGAGIGAGAGLLGGFIYDTVSKNNDRHRYDNHAASVNAGRTSEWKAKVKALDQQRNAIKQAALAEQNKALDELASRIAANNGHLDGVVPPISAEPIGSADGPTAVPTDAAPTAEQPSGPIVPTPGPATDAALKQKLLGYWKSQKKIYNYTSDGWCHQVNGRSKNQWDIVNNVYHDHETNGRDFTYDILTLTDKKFVYRSRAYPATFTLMRITEDEAEQK
jgi:hypothetical protein